MMSKKKRAWIIRIVALVCVLLLFGSVFISAILR